MASLITYTNLPTVNGDHLGSIEKDKAIDYRNWYKIEIEIITIMIITNNNKMILLESPMIE
jgi:hypothetical protein